MSIEELGKATSNKLYVGFMVAFFGALFSGNSSVPILILVISILVIVGGMFRSLPQFSGVSEEIYKLQLFLLVASLFVVIFWYLLPYIVPLLHTAQLPVAVNGSTSFPKFPRALGIILEFGGQTLSLVGLIVALIGLRK